jgi:translation elongation factor P/translation initiation factor 5A
METVIATSDEFEFVEDDSNFVHIMDGENTVRLSIPRDILNDLVMQVYSRVDTHI